MVRILVLGEPVAGVGWDTSRDMLEEMTGEPGQARVLLVSELKGSFSRLEIRGELGGMDLAGEGNLFPSLGSDPFVLILGAGTELGLV